MILQFSIVRTTPSIGFLLLLLQEGNRAPKKGTGLLTAVFRGLGKVPVYIEPLSHLVFKLDCDLLAFWLPSFGNKSFTIGQSGA